MKDKEIIKQLRQMVGGFPAFAIAQALDTALPYPCSAVPFVSYFKTAFPSIPLQILIEGAACYEAIVAHTVEDIKMDALKERFNGLFELWLPG